MLPGKTTHCLEVGQHGLPTLQGTHIEGMGSMRGAALVGQAFERLSRGPKTRLVPSDQGDGGALGCKELSDGQPYASATACHDGACAGKGRRHARGWCGVWQVCVWFYCSVDEIVSESEFDGPRRQGTLSTIANEQSVNSQPDEDDAVTPALLCTNTWSPGGM